METARQLSYRQLATTIQRSLNRSCKLVLKRACRIATPERASGGRFARPKEIAKVFVAAAADAEKGRRCCEAQIESGRASGTERQG